MEIWNNVWNFLTSQSEVNTKIITLPFLFVEVYLSILTTETLIKINLSKLQKIIYFISFSAMMLVSSLFITSPYNIIINYIFLFTLLKYFKINYLRTILSIILPFCIFGLVNSLLLNPFLKVFNITFETCYTTPIYRFAYLLFTYLTIYLILLIIRHTKFKINFDINMDKKTASTILTNLILGIITLFVQAVLNFYYINTIPIVFTLFNFALLFAYFFTSFYSLTKAMKLDIATRNLENAESYNNSLTVLYDNVKGFKHDFDNMVNIISGYIQVDDIDGLKHYFSSFEKDCNKVNNVQMLNPNIINNPGIYNLIVSKYKKATDLDVTINFEFFFDFDNLHMPIYEFSRILGILLDNAIEAAKDCEKRQINLVFREARKQQVQIVIIENTYSNKNIDTNKIFEKGVSGKENHSGIGLWEVHQIVKRFNNIVLNTTKDDKFFKQELQIYY